MIKISELVQKKQEKQSKKTTTFGNNEYTDEEIRVSLRLREDKIKQKISFFKRISSIPTNFEQFNFENAVVDSKQEQEVKAKLEYYCDNFKKAKNMGIGLCLVGKIGTGKTFYSLCVMNSLIEKRYKIYRTSLNSIFQRMRDTINKESKETIEEIFKNLTEADLIILDDVGVEYMTSWGKAQLFDIFNFFYEKNKCIVMTTSLEQEKFKEFMQVNDDNPILDRFSQKIKTLKFTWKSKRKEIGEKIFKEFWNEI